MGTIIVIILGLQMGRLRSRRIKQSQGHVANRQMSQDSNPGLSDLVGPCPLYHTIWGKTSWPRLQYLDAGQAFCKGSHMAKDTDEHNLKTKASHLTWIRSEQGTGGAKVESTWGVWFMESLEPVGGVET